MNITKRNWLALLMSFSICQSTQAQIVAGLSSQPKPKHPIATIVSEDVVAIAAIDVEQLQEPQVAQAIKAIAELGLVPAEVLAIVEPAIANELDHIGKLKEFGAKKIYALVRPDDASTPAMCFVVPLGSNAKEGTAEKIITHFQERELFKQMKFQIEPGALVVSESKPHIESLLNGPARKDLASVYEALKRVDQEDICLTVIGNQDTRRVLRELVPNMAGAFEGLSGKLIADEIDRLTVSLSFESSTNFSIEVDTKSPKTAAVVQRVLPSGIRWILENEELKQGLPPGFGQKIAPILKPRTKKNTVVISNVASTDQDDE